MRHDLAALSIDCPFLGFHGKFADIDALSRGDAWALRPLLAESDRARLAAMPPPGRQVALVIGGNGFVGAHLAARLSRAPGVRAVWTTVRATAEHTPEQRFAQTLAQYQINDIDHSKIMLIPADPTRPLFGLPAGEYQDLAEQVDLVFNCASSSDYSASYLQLRDDWVKSLLRILHFCAEARRKHLTYLGSVSAYFYQRPADFRRPDSWWYSGYAQMKWVNGHLLRWLARDGTLPVTLCESPYVLGGTRVGLDPAQHYSWWRIIEIARSLGVLWAGPGMIYIPVDVLADVVVTNALRAEPLPRILPRNPVPYDNALLAELMSVDLVSWPQFLERASAQISARRMNTVLSANFAELVEIVNAEPAVLPPGHDPSWCDHRRLYELYLGNISFRDVRAASRPERVGAHA